MDIPCINPCVQCSPGVGGGIGPIDPANPFVNLSSEAPDVDEFIGINYPPGFPPLGGVWYSIGCIGFCRSTISQADADLCAARQAIDCQSINWPVVDPNPPGGGNPGVPTPRPTFSNNAQFCTFTCPDGSPFVFTVAAGLFSAFSQLAADLEAYSYACNQVVANRLCLGPLAPSLTCAGGAYAGEVVASSAHLPIGFSVIGDLPDGLLLAQNATTALFSGVPSTPGDYTFTLQADDSAGNTVHKVYGLAVFGITNDSELPDADQDAPYSVTLETAGTVTGAITFSIISGVLPTGLALDADTGEISGTPTEDGAFQFQVVAAGGGLECAKQFDLFVGVTGFPDFLYTDLGGNGGLLTAATINGFDYLMGEPTLGESLGNTLEVLWDVISIPATGYTIAFQGAAVAFLVDEDGTYRFTMNNSTIVPNSGFGHDQEFTIFLNGVSQYIYKLDTTTGIVVQDVVAAVGDVLSYVFAVDGTDAVNPTGSFAFTNAVTKL